MIDFKRLTIDDRDIVNNFLLDCNVECGERNFTNLYMWRESYNIYYAIEGDTIYLVSNSKEPFAFFPMKRAGNITEKEINNVIEYFTERKLPVIFKRVSKKEKELFEKEYSGNAEIIRDVDNDDYVYLREALATLKGKKLHSKRNHINKFKQNYQYYYEQLNKENISYCYEITDKWFEDRGNVTGEKKAIYNMLDDFESLNYSGGLIKVDGEYMAFTLGERLNDDTVLIHIEKADSKIQGLYAVINQEFCKRLDEYMYVNREQDMGIEGIRKAKKSYYPAKMIEKYVIRIK